ncbi:hypothetical protein Taro_025757 [Colocasia esculenta]|uniref:Pectinesterase n=1 Tax=Colocasia esculenta TaxID=4460 RepID=A0A843VA63_COLES|nr:hypothetical protein [Colocasia esculenta]
MDWRSRLIPSFTGETSQQHPSRWDEETVTMECIFLVSTLGVALLMGSSLTFSVSASVFVASSIFVAKSGGGNFSTIQEAIDAVPYNNNQWTRIHVAAGRREKVAIPRGKEFIMLEGEGSDKTSIEWVAHASATVSVPDTATFTLLADNFVAKRIAIKNVYNSPEGYPSAQALAAIIWGDKAAFYDCSFISYQDTLCDMDGHHYFSNCYIEGAVDFIFGRGRSMYEGCTLYASGHPSSVGWLTAQGRNSSKDMSGFVFNHCTVTGPGKTYLGRAWGAFARVIFYQTYMSDNVVPEGWQAWDNEGHQAQIIYAESECTGPGSDTSKRVPWEKKLSGHNLEKYVSLRFVNRDGWLNQQP